jgi:hypothetical protein
VINDPDRPDFATLLDWLEGRLDPETTECVAARVTGAGESTRRAVEWLRGFLGAARALPLHKPPPIVRQSLTQYFARWSRAQAEIGHEPRVVHVQLLFDSRRDLAAAGVRAGRSADDAVHLVYASADGDLLVDVYRLESGSVLLDGQVLPAEPQEAPVFEASVTAAGFGVRTKDGDELGRFSLRDVPAGHSQLTATNGMITIVADLDLDPGD